MRIRGTLSKSITQEKFAFLSRRQIHEVVGLAWEVMNSVKTKRLPSMVLKVDISKAYDRVRWLYLRFIMLQVGFQLALDNWVMSCIQSVSFVLLIQGFSGGFFKPRRGLTQGSHLFLCYFWWL